MDQNLSFCVRFLFWVFKFLCEGVRKRVETAGFLEWLFVYGFKCFYFGMSC